MTNSYQKSVWKTRLRNQEELGTLALTSNIVDLPTPGAPLRMSSF